jgi:methylated-DNA-[protein]-cysteine S-methyltransferase
MNEDHADFTFASPLGNLRLEAESGALTELEFLADHTSTTRVSAKPRDPLLREACDELSAYFRSALRSFSIPLRPSGTPFQLRVWNALLEIPFGTSWSYRDLATRIGHPAASRAVGAANGRNPIAIIIPCHRVIGASKSLTGYGGGLERKAWLLRHERIPFVDPAEKASQLIFTY